MTDPNTGRPADADQTIPLVPDGGYAPPAQRPFDETLVDPLKPSDPWSSGPGLSDTTAPLPAPPLPAPPLPTRTQPPAAPAASWQPTSPTPAPQPWQPPTPAAYPPAPGGYGQPAPYPQPAPAAPPVWREGFAEPEGPAASIPNQPYAPTPYAAQQWPATIPDPVNHNYGYGYTGFDAAADHPNAMPALILGILSIVLFPLVGPLAWYLAAKGQREARLDPGRWRTGGMLSAGKVLGIIGTVFLVLGVLFFMAILLFAFVASA